MTKDEALKLALEALELYQSKMSVDMFDVAITALRQALEQPDAIEAAVRAENEACAAICDAEMDEWVDSKVNATNLALLNVAEAIRARGE